VTEDAAPGRLFDICCTLLRRRDPRAAELLPLLEAHPTYAPGWQDLAATLLDAGRIEAAFVAAQRSVAADPGGVAAQLVLATACMRLGRGREAVAALEAAELHAPDHAGLPYQRGLFLRQLEDQRSACAALERAATIEPGLARAWFALGLARQDLDDHDGAAAAYRAALAAQPDLHEAALNLGIALQEARQLDAALDAYAACYRMHPHSFGRIAQAIVAAPVGRLWLDLAGLRAALAARA
jgi:tetratricopeptide (TPR) repeat protein